MLTYSFQLYTGRNASASWEVLANAFPSVDTFFFLSGLLVTYLSMLEMEKKRFNLALFYVHRYIRLTIPVALVLLFIVGIEPHLGSGPFWGSMENTIVGNCRKNWWTVLLYVNNMVGMDAQCLSQSWYLACDMQFYVYSPLVIVPLYKCHGKNWWGVKWLLLHLAVFTAVPVALAWKYNLPLTNIML